jgi:membrane protein YqaA with SNARE-associated domain
MWLKYLYVFLASAAVDIVPLPLPPAFVVMVFLQIRFQLEVWPVIIIGVAGSVLGRYILTLYIPKIAHHIFKPDKNEDVQYLGKKLKEKGWKSQLAILSYSLLPLPTTPLFIAGGMANLKPIYIIPAFIVGKFTSDALAVFMGKFAAEHANEVWNGVVSWQSITGLIFGLLLVAAFLFIDWRSLLRDKRLRFNLKIWK